MSESWTEEEKIPIKVPKATPPPKKPEEKKEEEKKDGESKDEKMDGDEPAAEKGEEKPDAA